MSLSREEVIRMAKESGFAQRHNAPNEWWMLTPDIERFFNAAYAAGAAAEREACAKVCEEIGPKGVEFDLITQGFAGAIRARGNGGEK